MSKNSANAKKENKEGNISIPCTPAQRAKIVRAAAVPQMGVGLGSLSGTVMAGAWPYIDRLLAKADDADETGESKAN